MKYRVILPTLILAVIALAGCKAPTDIAYFQDMQELQESTSQKVKEVKAKTMDKLTVIVKSKDNELAMPLNLYTQAGRVGNGSVSAAGYSNNNMCYYTVDANGNIDMPVLGEVHVAGMGRTEIAAHVKNELIKRSIVLDPTVTVEFVDMSYSVIGEVRNPGMFTFDRDRLTILQAISRAGDLQITGERTNVCVIREENGLAKHYYVDLTNAQSVYNSPVYYLQQDDIVYVEPNAKRMRESRPNGNTFNTASFWISIVSMVASLTSIAVNMAK